MGLDDFSPDIDSAESGGQTSEVSNKVSEKFKEGVKRGAKGIKRTQKDEKKAKKGDFMLANFLVKFILNKKYDILIDKIFGSIHMGYPSNFILGILSLINIELSNSIRDLSGKDKIIFKYSNDQRLEFSDNTLDQDIRNRINFWLEDIIDITTYDYSSVKIKELLILLSKDENITDLTSDIFKFFLNEINISISDSKSYSISEYIIGEVKKGVSGLNLEEI